MRWHLSSKRLQNNVTLTYHSVEFAALVALRAAVGGFVLAGAKLAEVLRRLGHRVGEEVEFDPA